MLKKFTFPFVTHEHRGKFFTLFLKIVINQFFLNGYMIFFHFEMEEDIDPKFGSILFCNLYYILLSISVKIAIRI